MKAFELIDWKFYLGDEKNAWKKDFDDTRWEEVIVPHDWSIHQDFTREASSGTGYLPGGIGWYRSKVSISEIKMFNTVRLQFEGIYKNSAVWVNGYHLGGRPSGYASFSFDITELIKYAVDDELVIAVSVQHTDLADSRWYNGSGITRPVKITGHKALQIIEYGTFFQTKKIDEKEATIEITHTIKNNSESEVEITIVEELKSLTKFDKKVFNTKSVLKPYEQKCIILEEKISDYELWSDENPHLYLLSTRIINHGTEEISCYEETVGIRTFQFSPNDGFTINGAAKKLKGVCLHEDAGCFGVSVPSVVWLRRLQKLKEMGANAIRMAHNPHSKNLYRLCDLLGFYVIDEAFDEWENPKNKWWQGHNVYPPKYEGYSQYFPNWYQADLENMIDNNKNHPSIIAWSIGNEIDYPNDPYANPLFSEMTGNNDAAKPSEEKIYNPNRPDTRRLTTIAEQLVDIVKVKDTSRPVTLAAAFPELSSHTGLLDAIDLIGYNYKEHLYEADHQRYPNQPLIGSENGHGYEQWKVVKENDYVGGQFLWTGIDYLGEAHGWPIHGSGAGLLTLAGFEKPNFYLRKSWWSDQPTIYLTTRLVDEKNHEYYPFFKKWDYAEGSLVEVFCFSNCESVMLHSAGNEWPMEYEEELGYFKATIPATTSPLRAIGKIDDFEINDQIEAAMSACNLKLNKWQYSKKLTNEGAVSNINFEKNLIQIECQLIDRLGNTAANDLVIEVTIKGGHLLGLENGNLGDVTSYSNHYRSTYKGQLMIYLIGDELTQLSIRGDGIKTQNISIGEIVMR